MRTRGLPNAHEGAIHALKGEFRYRTRLRGSFRTRLRRPFSIARLTWEGLEIFYRESGPRDAPTVLLLHGFPSSSHMFRNLIPMLADKYHVVAPDFPGYGESSAPSVNDFDYSYERLAAVTEKFTEKLNLSSYALYLSDIGSSVGFRLAVMHPERVTAMIVQNGDAHVEAINKEFAKGLFDYWEDRSEKNAQVLLDWFLTIEGTKWHDLHGVSESPLGAGGMGEVYRARDARLGRDVALKVLPEAFAADAERMARSEREAKVLASLNHPNIAAIYGLEESNSVRALVLELVDGPTLAERIAQGPIPIEEALPIAKQICNGLEYAHERAIIHRDLKPANVKITPEGSVKLLDFGLAKALEGEAVAGDILTSPTISHLATQAGIILGTAAYMSPEQAKGKAVDRRADIWGFGCLLYEMLTGKPAFGGEAVTETLATVIRDEPDWSTLRRPLRRAFAICLSGVCART